jgi:serine phosphatase RsbU (regulator of sigma subunit)
VEHIPFGDMTLTLVMSPYQDLGGLLLADLPWIVLGGGLLLTLGASALTEVLLRRRRYAELLALENARLYTEQRAAAHTLQQNLLPRSLPDVPEVEVVVRYVPGVSGTEVGGDWYDVIEVEGRLVVVVGDVSGRGLAAAGVMASVRYAMRALAAQGFAPEEILARVDLVDADERDGHFATVLCGVIDVATGVVSFANAGHPPPLLVTDAGARFVETRVGPPVGVVGQATYETVETTMPPGSTLLMVTDGLFERRGESIDVGLERLRASAESATGDLASRVDQVLEELTGGEANDDAAILAVRWRA